MNRKKRMDEQREAVARNTAKLRKVQGQRDEVRELAQWAKVTRERNHLSELFVRSIRGRHA